MFFRFCDFAVMIVDRLFAVFYPLTTGKLFVKHLIGLTACFRRPSRPAPQRRAARTTPQRAFAASHLPLSGSS